MRSISNLKWLIGKSYLHEETYEITRFVRSLQPHTETAPDRAQLLFEVRAYREGEKPKGKNNPLLAFGARKYVLRADDLVVLQAWDK